MVGDEEVSDVEVEVLLFDVVTDDVSGGEMKFFVVFRRLTSSEVLEMLRYLANRFSKYVFIL